MQNLVLVTWETQAVFDCLVAGILHFFGQFRGQLEVLALAKIHPVGNYFPKKKACSTIKLFFFFKYVLYWTVLSKYLKKIGGHRGRLREKENLFRYRA